MTERRAELGGSSRTDFERLWRAYALSQFGVAFGMGAVAFIAIDRLGASALEVAVTLGAARLIGAVLSIPVGALVERRPKRPLLIRVDLLRFWTTIAIPLLIWFDRLSLLTLGLVLTVDVFVSIVGAAASGAHLRDLVEDDGLSHAFAKLQTTTWVFTALFTPLGGLVVSLLGPTVPLSVDALTYVASAVLLSRIRKREDPPPRLELSGVRTFLKQVTAGWTYIWGNKPLRGLYENAMLFGGSLVLASPLVAVLVLRELDLEAWHYSLILGLPAVGGVIGTRLAGAAESRLGRSGALLAFGSLRTVWTVWMCLSPSGVGGFVVVLVLESMLMFSAGLFNPTFAAHQISITANDFLARTSAAWRASAMILQPIFMIAGGLLAGWFGVRSTIAVAGSVMMLSSLFLPWTDSERE